MLKQKFTAKPIRLLTYTFSPALIGADAFTGALIRDAGEAVAQYDINQGTLALSGDYTLVYTGAKLTVTPLTINVTADAQTKVYGETDPALTYTFSPALIGADAFTGALTRDAGEAVAQYDINQGTLALSGDYTLVYTGAKLTVTPLTINVTADAQTKVYGETDPALTYTFSPALIGADAFTGALIRDAGEAVAQYDIKQGTLALSGDYTLVYTGAKLTVTPLTINVTADAQTKVYGETDPALTYTFSPALIGADAFTGALTRDAGEAVAQYDINQGTLALSGDYTLVYTGAKLHCHSADNQRNCRCSNKSLRRNRSCFNLHFQSCINRSRCFHRRFDT